MDVSSPSRLSELVGLPVVERAGGRLGRLDDLTVLLGGARPAAVQLLVRAGRSTRHLVPWADVEDVTASEVALREHARARPVERSAVPLDEHEVLLRRDVLDTQVVDLGGQRLSRVSEVLLDLTGDGLRVVAVDLGLAALVRRLGLGILVGRRPASAVDWADLHLTSRRGHLVQLSTSESAFHALDSHALAQLLPRLSTHEAADLVRTVEPSVGAAALHHSHPHTGRRLLRALGDGERRRLMAAAEGDQARVLEDLGRPGSPSADRRFRRTTGWRMHRPPRAAP